MIGHPARTAAAILLLLGLLAPVAAAQALPAPTQAVLLLRVLAYDHDLKARSGGSATIDVVYQKGDAESETMASQVVATLQALSAKASLNGLPIKVNPIAYGGGLDPQIGTSPAVAFFICAGLDDDTASIAESAQTHHALTFTGQETAVDQGLAIGLVMRGSKGTILVNLPAARAEGADLDADLLGLAEIVGR